MSAASAQTKSPSAQTGIARLANPWTALVGGCLAIAALSLLYPTTPTYDPWAWIIWGREIINFDLTTTTGPSWKPLPAIFTTVFAPFGSAAPDLWVMVARAGGLLALAGGFRVASRLVEEITDSRMSRWSPPAVFGGACAIAAMLLQSEFAKATMLGNSEGLLVASVLFAFDRNLDGDRRSALLLIAAAGLLRPEMWPFLGLYGLFLLWRHRELWPWVVGVGVAVPVLWLLPEYIGSGNLFRAADRAQDLKYVPWSPALAPDPTGRILDMTELMLPADAWRMAIVGGLFSLWALFKRNFVPAAFCLLPVAWVAIVARMTESGYAGNPRYLLLGTALFCVVAATGVGSLLAFAWLLAAKVDTRLGPVAFVGLIFAGVAYAVIGGNLDGRIDRWTRLDGYLHNEYEHRATLPKAIELAGGRERVLACGEITTNNFQVPMLAWYLDAHVNQVGIDPLGPGTTFQTKTNPRSKLDPPTGPPGATVVGVEPPWIILRKCR